MSGEAAAATKPDPAKPSKAARVWKRTWIGAAMVAILVLILSLAKGNPGGPVPLIAGAILALLAGLELSRLGKLRSRGLMFAHLYVWTFFLYWAVRWKLERTDSGVGDWLLAVVVAGVLGAGGGFIAGYDRKRLYVPAALAAWVLPPLFLVPRIGAWWGIGGLIALLVLSKVGDIAGYFTGNAIGKTHPFPSISPGKTTAGCVGSLIAGTIAGGVCVALGLLPDAKLGIFGGLLAGAALNIAAQAGDLAESWVKRRAAAKDSATWFGPAGGVLDLVDSLLFSVPAALLVWPIVFASA